ncbi:Aste57867_20043 [Aphanomyces stellatus]|uniref:Histone-lysine N-methyltransferase, H3 lysine-79 specific n=1 Tax=Aphanomyces stellatus TaxID=120398 RepID=A0A485LIQ0_9STRA|nr:hypothetical protein As57867_019977 [Aphanomyces stellatus]VFT96739.1 Aste57867_20043 [Aphanomyces stellatus]
MQQRRNRPRQFLGSVASSESCATQESTAKGAAEASTAALQDDKRKHTPTGTTPVRENKRTEPRRCKRLPDLDATTPSPTRMLSPDDPVINLVTSGSSDDSEISISPKQKRSSARLQNRKPVDVRSDNDSESGACPSFPSTLTSSPSDGLVDLSRHTTLCPTDAIKLLKRVFVEVEDDDRAMYRLTNDVIRDETATCEKSQLVELSDAATLKRMCTYGEVLPEAISSVVMPLLQLTPTDVFYDLGCGTGKIILQVALETNCVVAKGMELMLNRVVEGARALERVRRWCPRVVAHKTIVIVQGDICYPPDEANTMDATVVFINNVVFPPDLMSSVLEMLGRMKQLKRIVSMRKLCERHRDERCGRKKSPCVHFKHPPQEHTVLVSWAKHASCYVYERESS